MFLWTLDSRVDIDSRGSTKRGSTNFKFNSVQNVIHKTFAVFGCPKIACSRDGARDFFVIHAPVNNALSPSRADARETV